MNNIEIKPMGKDTEYPYYQVLLNGVPIDNPDQESDAIDLSNRLRGALEKPMPNNCRTCKHYQGPDQVDILSGNLHGYCQRITSEGYKTELAYTDEDDCSTTQLRVMEEFGCVLHTAKEESND